MSLHSQKAFTLIELMITVAIIALLTAIILTNLNQPKVRARDAKRVSDIGQLQLALELFFDRCNRYPIVQNGMPRLVDPDLNDLTNAPKNGCPDGISLSTF